MNIQELQTLLTEAGATVWEKGTMKRIYINQDVADAVFNRNLLKDYSKIAVFVTKKDKFFLDLNTMSLISDSGKIRTAINATSSEHGLQCVKP